MPEPGNEPVPENEPTITPPEPAAEPVDANAFKPITSQEEFDRRLRDRLTRQKAQFSDYDALKDKASKFDELEAANKTELERAQTRTAELEHQVTEVAARAQEALLRSAVISEAARKNVVDPDAALALLDRTVLEFDDAGVPKNMGDAIDSLLEAKPYLAGTRAAGSADLGARGSNVAGQLTRDDLKTMSDEDIVKAQKDGRLDHMMQRRTP